MKKGNVEKRISQLEQGMTHIPGPVVCYGYNAGDMGEHEGNRQAAICEWQEEHGKKLDEKNTQWVVWEIFTTREQVEKYSDSSPTAGKTRRAIERG
jgi:hypothetical protein